MAQPLSHPSLMLGTQRILSQAAQAGKHHHQLLRQLLVPFISFVLLQNRPDSSGRLSCSVICVGTCTISCLRLPLWAAGCRSQLSAVFVTSVGVLIIHMCQLNTSEIALGTYLSLTMLHFHTARWTVNLTNITCSVALVCTVAGQLLDSCRHSLLPLMQSPSRTCTKAHCVKIDLSKRGIKTLHTESLLSVKRMCLLSLSLVLQAITFQKEVGLLPAESFPVICIPCRLNLAVYCAAGRHIALKCGMHAQLVRAACSLPALQASLLPQLVSFLGAYSWSDAAQAAWLVSLIPDLVDAVQITEGSTGVLLEGGGVGVLHLCYLVLNLTKCRATCWGALYLWTDASGVRGLGVCGGMSPAKTVLQH